MDDSAALSDLLGREGEGVRLPGLAQTHPSFRVLTLG